MYGRERRQSSELDTKALREGLTAAQLNALETLEHFGWTLRFVRKPMFRDPIPVLFHRDGKRYVVLEADGTLDETPDLVIRDCPHADIGYDLWAAMAAIAPPPPRPPTLRPHTGLPSTYPPPPPLPANANP